MQVQMATMQDMCQQMQEMLVKEQTSQEAQIGTDHIDGREEEEGEQAQQACSTHGQRGTFPFALPDVLHGRDLQRGQECVRTERDVQMEDPSVDVASEDGSGKRPRPTLEEELLVAHAHGRPTSGQPLGSSRVGQAAVFQPQDLLPGGRRQGGQTGTTQRELKDELMDPNAPTPQEQIRRAEDGVDVVQSDGLSHGALPGTLSISWSPSSFGGISTCRSTATR